MNGERKDGEKWKGVPQKKLTTLGVVILSIQVYDQGEKGGGESLRKGEGVKFKRRNPLAQNRREGI